MHGRLLLLLFPIVFSLVSIIRISEAEFAVAGKSRQRKPINITDMGFLPEIKDDGITTSTHASRGSARKPVFIVRKQKPLDGDNDNSSNGTFEEWNTIPDEGIPFPLVIQTAPLRAIALISVTPANVHGSVIFEQQDANAVGCSR